MGTVPTNVTPAVHPLPISFSARIFVILATEMSVIQTAHIGLNTMPKKVTSKSAAKSASKVLRDKRTGQHSKTAAGSALSQREPKKRK